MFRAERVRAALRELERKGPPVAWPLHWGKFELLPAEKDWLIHFDRYAAKWPSLMADPDFAPPPVSNAEQASSQATALWRGQWLRSHSGDQSAGHLETPHALDLTGGSGIDSWGLERAGYQVTTVEPDPYLTQLLTWNGNRVNRHVIQGKAEDQEFGTLQFQTVFVDPSRRTSSGRIAIRELGEPDPFTHLRTWQKWGAYVAIKLSPMLDAREVSRWFPEADEFIYVSVRREVKELVVGIPLERKSKTKFIAVSVDDEGHELLRWTTQPSVLPARATAVGAYLFDPDPALAASGGAASWAAAHNLEGLHPDSRLFTSNILSNTPCSRVFSVDSIHATLPNHLKAASVVARAFPERADVLRKRLRLAEDSERFLFATRLAGSLDHVYIVATRLA
jgi:hypothetical protein